MKEIRQNIRKTFPRLYFNVFTWRNEKKFSNEVEVDAYTVKNINPFVSSLEEAIDYLQSRASMYR